MTVGAAIQNAVVLSLPVVVYALVVRWRARLPISEIAVRIGLSRSKLRPLLIALAACVPAAIIGVMASSSTKGFQGSMLAPFIDASPSIPVFVSVVSYGLIATGFPEELLFRGVIAGALFRRLSFWKANLIQASIFLLPHLLILIVAPSLWPLAILLPLTLGLLTGWLRHTGGSIAPAVIIHAIGNMAGALAVLNWDA